MFALLYNIISLKEEKLCVLDTASVIFRRISASSIVCSHSDLFHSSVSNVMRNEDVASVQRLPARLDLLLPRDLPCHFQLPRCVCETPGIVQTLLIFFSPASWEASYWPLLFLRLTITRHFTLEVIQVPAAAAAAAEPLCIQDMLKFLWFIRVLCNATLIGNLVQQQLLVQGDWSWIGSERLDFQRQ